MRIKVIKMWRMPISGWISGIILLLVTGGCRNHSAQMGNLFRYNEQTGIASLDPAFAKNQSVMWAVHQLYNTLVEVGPDLQIRPSLAYRWEISPEGTIYRFFLRQDVQFHSDSVFPGGVGRKMLAGDVVFSLQRIIDPATASPGAWIFNQRISKDQPFRAVNDSVFELHLTAPFQPMLGILTMPYCSIVAPEAVRSYGPDFRRHPVGTGPFQLKIWEEGFALLMHRNPAYFEKDENGKSLPYLDGIRISFLDSKAAEFLEFSQGRIDFVNDLEASFIDEVLTKDGALQTAWLNKIQLQKHPYLNTEYLGIYADTSSDLMRQSPLRWKAIRQAINYGFDRRKLIRYMRNSIGYPAESGFIPIGLPSFDSSRVRGYQYDPGKTAQLLRDAGFPGGKGLPEIKLMTIPVYADLAGYIASELKLSGIPVKVDVMPKSFLLEQTAHGTAPFFRASWIADYPDAENYLAVFYGPNPAPPNYTRYRNLRFDSLYRCSVAEPNLQQRYRLYQQMDQLLIDDAPVVPLWYDMAIHLVQKNISGFTPNSLNMLELRRTKKGAGAP